ncbi:hypothetical protein MHH52_23850 [Paenibacillus sp. FSL K6-0276]|uniref:hypothetical protein n=1 Tax=Paenibacillus sp. FSL K6-0276 TaxID=2921450 RepID=UPI0030EB2544
MDGGVLLLLLLVGCGNPVIDNSAKPSSTVGDNAEAEVTETEKMGEQSDDTIEEAVGGTAKPAEVEFKHLENVFGFADESGKQLITIPDDSGADLDNPEQFNA